jgi:cytochrome c peroxidase
MSGKRLLIATLIAAFGVVLVFSVVAASPVLTPKEQLGKLIFFDHDLSINENQDCAACHGPEVGWTGPNELANMHGAVYEGSIPGAFGARKPPSSAYATFSPIFHMDKKGLFVGGNFWDGRATGEILGSPSAEQAKGPFLNPKEQALPDAAALVGKVCAATYGDLFREVWGSSICDPANVNKAYDAIGYSVAAYEGSAEVNAFSSKFDYARKGKAKLTQLEQKGYALFRGKGGCESCHPSNGQNALFTDFTFDNLGLPKNPENPVYTYDHLLMPIWGSTKSQRCVTWT